MQKQRLPKRNPVARVLIDPRYHKRVVKSKKLYSRKNVKAPKEPLTFFVSMV
jgi:hypothetical protein